MADIRVGTAGWSIRREQASVFPPEGSHLERYARVFTAVEINSSFYRPHRPTTYVRWGTAVPPGFRFALKVPREITHRHRLADTGALLERFLSECRMLGNALGPLLVQLPPSLLFVEPVASAFFALLRSLFSGSVVCEPRHHSWFTEQAEALLIRHQVARVGADPPPVPEARRPGGWAGLAYHRLHGSPEIYVSAYTEPALSALAHELHLAAEGGAECWCIFDNTAAGAAVGNALSLLRLL